MKDWKEQVITAALTVGVVLLFAATVHLPRYRSLRQVQGQIHTLQQRLAETQQQCGALTPLTQQVARLRDAAILCEQKLPLDSEVGPFLQNVAERMRQSQLRSLEMRPSAPTTGMRCTELPIKLGFEGQFAGIFGFLTQLESMNRAKRIVGLTLTSAMGPDETVQADVMLSIYCSKG